MEHKISKLLVKNYLNIQRDLPWRHTKDPYKIWISEVILQQTRVNQGLPYYYAFVEEYPDVVSLANAQEDAVLKLWQGLGYYSRARNMLQTAKAVAATYGNAFPSNYNDLILLKGIGDYTAAAVSSFSANEPRAVVDGNVTRVLSRIFGISEAVDTASGKKQIIDAATAILDTENPGAHNQALMEHGALVCTPKKPRCLQCPVMDICAAYSEKRQEDYPYKRPKKASRNRHFVYWIINDGKNVLLQKRPANDIWAGLYQFPLSETENSPNDEDIVLLAKITWKMLSMIRLTIKPPVKHILSHQNLHIRFVHIYTERIPSISDFITIHQKEMEKYPFPIVIAKYLEQNQVFNR